MKTERTEVQDIEFGLQKLVENALRAISPAIKDPHSAINAINRIGTLLFEVANREPLSSYLYDREGYWRVKILEFDFEHYLYKAFYQIRYYAKDDVSVTTAIIYVLKLLASQSSGSLKKHWLNLHSLFMMALKKIYSGLTKAIFINIWMNLPRLLV